MITPTYSYFSACREITEMDYPTVSARPFGSPSINRKRQPQKEKDSDAE
ncbi:hypothetical protein X777_11756 [Ooceraea biroi]|uniref:Uncharacterized protein n=1 Tax=Ooceraea biroi TaxID=2015173 RepID=A0A026W1I2_OOCBI|nr:hypothetical protein X777_11756 [Ooceraea biroi]